MDDVQIIETSPDGLVIQFRMSELKIDTKNVEGQTSQIVSFRSCTPAYAGVGKAQIPIRVICLGIPDEAELAVSVLNAEHDLLTGYKLATERDQELAPAYAGVRDQNSPAPYQGGFYPNALASIEPAGYIRQQRVARLELHPIQYNPSTGQLKVYKRLEVKVTFSMLDQGIGIRQQGSGLPLNPSDYSLNPFEDLYRDTLLNYEQARNWRKARHRESARLAPTPHEMETRYKLTIEKSGMYRLDYGYLTRAGIDPGTIDTRKIELRSGGELVPIYVEGYEDGKLDRDDFIEFYAVKMDNIYTDENVYWLSWSSLGSPGARSWIMAIKDGTPKASYLKPPVAFLDTKYWGKDLIYDPLKKMTAETADHFFWSAMRGQDPRHDRVIPFKLDLPGRAAGITRYSNLRVCFQGLTFARGASSHKVNVVLNGNVVDTAQWEGQNEYISETSLIQTYYVSESNWFSLHCEDSNGTSDATDPKWDVYLDWIEMDYWREFIADDGKLEFSTETVPPVTQTVQYAVKHFPQPNVEIFQIDRSSAVAKIINYKVEKDGAFYTVVFEDNVSQPTRYIMTSTSSMMRPASIVKDQPSTLHDPANRADYIMITHRDFRKSAERLADFRRKQGLDVTVVDIEDIYDEFSYGIFDPKAIKRFLRYAYFNWDKIPTYVLLIGDAHWDYKYAYHEIYMRYENYPRIYVPTYHAWSSPYGQSAMDHRFVTVSGDDILPDMFVGRLPVETAEEADGVVGKIIEYEDKPYRGMWQSRVLLAADDEKSKSGDEVFEDSREDLANNYIPVGYEVVPVYLRRIGEPYIARKIISMEINKGLSILEYAGHGGAHSWAHEYIFGWEDVGKLANHSRYPFVITTTCENGYFDNPTGGNKCIMELFLLQPRSGAVACLSATRLTYGQGNATFDKILYPEIFGEKPAVLGRIVDTAKIKFINLGIATWVPSAEQYTLFGDPATRLALPESNIECELAKSSVDSSKQLELRPGTVKRLKLDPLTGENKLVVDTEFNAQMQISVVYPNNLDEDKSNDLPVQSGSVNIWKGEFGEVLLPIPHGVIPGEGRLRFYASSGSSSAIGGIRFSVLKPVIEFYSGRIVNDESLQIHAAVVDNLGHAGIKSVECVWHNTETWKWHNYLMVTSGSPPAQTEVSVPQIEGLWYTLKDNIPLSRPGTSIEYKIKVIDTEGNEVISPLERIKVPIGVNLAISRPEPFALPGISYSYSSALSAWILSAPVENNGGKEVKQPIAVYFFEGSPDRNRDNIIDSEAEVLGSAVIEYDQWKPGERTIQAAEVSIKLDEPLYSGFHRIFVWINPRTRELNAQLGVKRVEDADNSDDTVSRLFQVNEFLIGKGNEATRAQSLDGTLSMVIPPDSVDETVMSITRLEPPEPKWKQPDLGLSPIPEYGLDGASAFRIQLASGVTSLREEAEIDIKFDVEKIRELAKELKGLAEKDEKQLSYTEREWIKNAMQAEAKKLGIYAWQEDIGVWRYIPSELIQNGDNPPYPWQTRDIRHETSVLSLKSKDEFAQEPYATLPISENRSGIQLDTENISVDEIITPLGNWIVFFLNADRYKLYLRREGLKTYEGLKYGEVGETYYNADIGLRLTISRGDKDFKFGDVFKFDTFQDLDGTIKLQSLRNYNKGDGTARVAIMTSDELHKVSHVAGEWAIFFTGPKTFEVHSQLGYLVTDPVGFPINGELGKNVLAPTIGVRIEIHEGRWPFQFGDKFVFRTLFAGTVHARTDFSRHNIQDTKSKAQGAENLESGVLSLGSSVLTLIHSSDVTPPEIQLWVNGLVPQSGVVIPPLPTISLLLSDANGIDVDSFSFLMSIDDRDFLPVPREDYVFSERSRDANSLTNVPIFYSPILNIGKYRYRIAVMDLNGSKAIGKTTQDNYLEFMFLVEEQPDLNPPVISVIADGQTLMNGQVFHKSPEFLISIEDAYALEESSISLSLAYADEPLEPLEESEYTMTMSDDDKNAVIIYTPHLMNGEYAIQVEATDTSNNSAYLTPPEAEPLRFRMDEEVEVHGVMNAPNPFSDTTAFSYSLTQPADKVTVKIYTLRGRLVRKLEQYSPKWQYNEEFWDGRDEDGHKLASGVYLYRFIVTDADKKIERIGKLAVIR